VDFAGAERVVDFLVQCRRDEWLYLPGVGWLTATHYLPYEGRNPRTGEPTKVPGKYLPTFHVDPELHRAMEGLPPSGRSFPDEFARYLHARHPDLEDHPDPTLEESFTVVRFPWMDEIAEAIRRYVLDARAADVPGLGAFEVTQDPGRPGVNPDTGERIRIPPRLVVRFKASDHLKLRLSEKRS
jgi:nucleoid DNA-binding protein